MKQPTAHNIQYMAGGRTGRARPPRKIQTALKWSRELIGEMEEISVSL